MCSSLCEYAGEREREGGGVKREREMERAGCIQDEHPTSLLPLPSSPFPIQASHLPVGFRKL